MSILLLKFFGYLVPLLMVTAEHIWKDGGDRLLYDNIKVMCSQKGISVGAMEKALGFSNGSICKWNNSEAGVQKVQKVANYLGVPIETLLKSTGEGE